MTIPGQPAAARRPMSAAELRVTREHIGLPIAWVAQQLGVAERAVTRWEAGSHPIPAGVADRIRRWQADTDAVVAETIRHLAAEQAPVMHTWRTDDEYHAAHPDRPWPASWHRALAGRAAERIPGLAIDYDADP